jgi:hypothetical protein
LIVAKSKTEAGECLNRWPENADCARGDFLKSSMRLLQIRTYVNVWLENVDGALSEGFLMRIRDGGASNKKRIRVKSTDFEPLRNRKDHEIPMRITNESNKKVFWRIFKADDTAYVVGLYESDLDSNKTGSWRDDSFPDIKVEVKTDGIFKEILARAGTKFKMTDDLVFTKDGNLQLAEPKLVTDQGQETVKRSDIQFIDLRGFNGTQERTVTSRVSSTFSSTAISESSSSHEQTWTAGGKIAGRIGEKNKPGGSAEISAQFQDKVVNALRNSYQSTVTSVWEKSVSDKLSFTAGKLYVMETIWSLTLDKGTANYFGERTTYTVVRSADAQLLKPSAYDSEEKLPKEYRDELARVLLRA